MQQGAEGVLGVGLTDGLVVPELECRQTVDALEVAVVGKDVDAPAQLSGKGLRIAKGDFARVALRM